MKNRTVTTTSICLLVGLMLSASYSTGGSKQDLSHLDFFYAGEGKVHHMYMVRGGEIAWHYHNPDGRGEISDAMLLADGNVLFAHQYGIAEITSGKEVVWSMDAPADCEIHTIQPIGKNHVVYVQNGTPAKAVIMHIPSKQVVREWELETKQPSSVHGQFRQARLTDRGTLLVAHMDIGRVKEYDSHGHILRSMDIAGPWSVTPLPEGNMLVTSNKGFVREVNKEDKIVWEINFREDPSYGVTSPQVAYRLRNGNTIINNWFNQWGKKPLDTDNPPLQAIEVTPDKKVVWELCSWKEPADLGPSTIIQPLNQPLNREKMFFGDIH